MVKNPAYRQYQDILAGSILWHRANNLIPDKPLAGHLLARLLIWMPDKRQRDMRNLPKAIDDALQVNCVIVNDCLIRVVEDKVMGYHRIWLEDSQEWEKGKLVYDIEEIEWCPVSFGQWQEEHSE